MKNKNIVALLALLFITQYLPAMELDPALENTAEKHQGHKRKTVGPPDKRNLKKIKSEVFWEEGEEEELLAHQVAQIEEAENIESYFNWDGLPDEIQLLILSFLINTQNVILGNEAECSAQFKQYALLKSVNKKMNDLASDKQLFDFDQIIVFYTRDAVQFKDEYSYMNKILKNAAKYGRIYTIQLAIENGLPITKYRYILTNASRFKNIKLCKKLILLRVIRSSINPALLHAIYLHDTDGVKALIASKKSSASLKNDSTELMIAAKIGNIQILNLLLNANPHDINAQNSSCKTALHLAVKKNDIKVIQLLLDNGADVDIKDYRKQTPLLIACINGNIEAAQLLLDNYANTELKDMHRRTPLCVACEHKNIELGQVLLDNNADINAKSNNGETALYWAIKKNNIKIAQLLLDNNADIEAKNDNGIAALHLCAHQRDTKLAQFLLDNGADIEAKTNNGETILHFCAFRGYTDVIQLLLDNGADIQAKTNNGQTALHFAAGLGRVEVVQLLLDNSADIHAKTNNGQTALDIAINKGHIRIVQLLNEKMHLTNQTNLTI